MTEGGGAMGMGGYLALGFFSWVLWNAVLAWAFTAFTDGHASTFWTAFLVLLAIRLLFAVADSLLHVLTFALYRKKFVVQQIVKDFHRLGFPKRENLNEDGLMYLRRLQQSEAMPFVVRRAAAFMEGQFDFADKAGVVLARQAESTLEAAVDAWSTTPAMAIRSQSAADEREYWEYEKARVAIRKKYDPRGEWNEGTPGIPEEYGREIDDLRRAHEGMLRRRNGYTDADFLEGTH